MGALNHPFSCVSFSNSPPPLNSHCGPGRAGAPDKMVQPGAGTRIPHSPDRGAERGCLSSRARGRKLRRLPERIPEQGLAPLAAKCSLPPPSLGSLQYDKCRTFWNAWILPPTTALFAISDQTDCVPISLYIFFQLVGISTDACLCSKKKQGAKFSTFIFRAIPTLSNARTQGEKNGDDILRTINGNASETNAPPPKKKGRGCALGHGATAFC